MQKVELEGCIQLRLRGGQDAKESVFVLMVPSNLMCGRPTQCIRAATGLGPSTPLLSMFALVQSRIANRILPIITAGRAATPPSASDMRWGPWETAVVDRSAFSYKNTLLSVTDCPGGWVWGVLIVHRSMLEDGRVA